VQSSSPTAATNTPTFVFYRPDTIPYPDQPCIIITEGESNCMTLQAILHCLTQEDCPFNALTLLEGLSGNLLQISHWHPQTFFSGRSKPIRSNLWPVTQQRKVVLVVVLDSGKYQLLCTAAAKTFAISAKM